MIVSELVGETFPAKYADEIGVGERRGMHVKKEMRKQSGLSLLVMINGNNEIARSRGW